MALALDASTPVAVTGNLKTMTTASFTPPAGSVLYICIGINSDVASSAPNSINHSTALTDNLAGHLTYTYRGEFGTESGGDTIVYLFTASVVSSSAMTVSATQTAVSGTASNALFRVLVVTGADQNNPVALSGGRGLTTNLTTQAQYTSTRDNSWGWLIYADWGQRGVPTVPAGETVDAQFDVAGQDTYAVIKNNSATATAGTTVTITTSTPTGGGGAALQLSYLYFEMLPQVAVTVTTSFSFNSSLENWAFNANGGSTIAGTRDTTEDSANDTNAGTGVMQSARTGNAVSNGTPYWEWSGAWSALGLPIDATVVSVNLSYDWKCATYTTGANTSATGPAELRDSGSTLRGTFSASATFSGTTAFVTRSGALISGLTDDAGTVIRLRIGAKPNTGASGAASVILRQDWVVVTVTYVARGRAMVMTKIARWRAGLW